MRRLQETHETASLALISLELILSMRSFIGITQLFRLTIFKDQVMITEIHFEMGKYKIIWVKDNVMKIVSVFGAMTMSALLALPVLAAPLNKYMDDSPATFIQQQLAPEEVRRRLNDKMQRSIQILNNMEGEEKAQWIREYKERLKQAIEAGDYLKAAYYSGILDHIEQQN